MSHSLHHTDAADTAKLLQELDRDSKSRSLTGGYKTAMTVLFVLYSLTMIVMALVVSGATQYTRLPVFVGMTLFVGYLKYPASKRDALRDNYFPWYDIVLAFASLGVFFYYAIEQKRIIQMANRIGTTQIVLGIIGILLLVELCRRSTGIPLIVVVGLFTVYGAWWLTNNNPKTALRNLIYNLFYNLNCGIFSSPITVCASFIVLFIILGSFLEKTGIGTFFVDLANSIAGASVGGPAKVAVISSALEGMYSGSSVANTVGSGSITIPTMKKVGYKPEFAAAVEAAASTGGQIMPPIMGTGAFLMAEMLGISYMAICKAAAIPAIMYYLAIFLLVHMLAKKRANAGETVEMDLECEPILPRLYLLSPIVVLVAAIAAGCTLQRSALYGIAAILVLNVISPKMRYGPIHIIQQILNATRLSSNTSQPISGCGIIIGIVSISGLATRLSSVISSMGGDLMWIGLIITMLGCMLLGMALPTVAAYLTAYVLFIPTLKSLGISTLAANLFIFYFGIFAQITPPVCIASYTAAGIAEAKPWDTGWRGMVFASVAFFAPFAFVYQPGILMEGGLLAIIHDSGILALGTAMLVFAVAGYLLTDIPIWQRILLVVGGICTCIPESFTDIVGLSIGVVIVVLQIFARKKYMAAHPELANAAKKVVHVEADTSKVNLDEEE